MSITLDVYLQGLWSYILCVCLYVCFRTNCCDFTYLIWPRLGIIGINFFNVFTVLRLLKMFDSKTLHINFP